MYFCGIRAHLVPLLVCCCQQDQIGELLGLAGVCQDYIHAGLWGWLLGSLHALALLLTGLRQGHPGTLSSHSALRDEFLLPGLEFANLDSVLREKTKTLVSGEAVGLGA